MSIGFAAAHAEIARCHLARDSAERIVGIIARTLPENADAVEFWTRIMEMAEDCVAVESAAVARKIKRPDHGRHRARESS